MTTLQQRWHEYREAVYTEPLPADQSRECHQAFFAGAMAAMAAMMTLAKELTEEEAEAEMAKMFREAAGISALHSFAMKLRN